MKDKIVVATSGTFDLCHVGHINFLKKSRELGDYLVVGIKSDEKVYEQKGYVPVMKLQERIKTLEILPWVDEVYVHQASIDGGVEEIVRKYNASFFTGGLDGAADQYIYPLVVSGYPVTYLKIDSESDVHTTNIKRRILEAQYGKSFYR